MASGIYNLYTTQEVFVWKKANVICNQIMQGLTEKAFPNLNEHFALTGDAARCFESASSGPIQCVQFATDSEEIYRFLASNLKLLCPDLSTLELYQQKLVFSFSGNYFEVLKVESITTRNYKGIYITV